MDSKKTQLNDVIAQLRATGAVSRNWALDRRITRLGALMFDLKAKGWDFTAGFEKYALGKDYWYRLVKKETPKQSEPQQLFTNVYNPHDAVWKL